MPLLADGYAVASIEYRLSSQAIFPAQIHDCKAAVRFLRANAARYHLDPNCFGAWGSSAGGHLAALLGTSGGVKELEGSAGNLEQSSRVQCVCDWFGPADLTTIVAQSGPEIKVPHDTADCPEAHLVGGPLGENLAKARLASPTTYVNKEAPPFLIMHGDRDDAIPLAQSQQLDAALRKAGVETTLIVIHGAGHGFGGPAAWARPDLSQPVKEFFDKHLKTGRLPEVGK
jgi:acetyl esterase/lipase